MAYRVLEIISKGIFKESGERISKIDEVVSMGVVEAVFKKKKVKEFSKKLSKWLAKELETEFTDEMPITISKFITVGVSKEIPKEFVKNRGIRKKISEGRS